MPTLQEQLQETEIVMQNIVKSKSKILNILIEMTILFL